MAVWDDIFPKEELTKFSSGGMGESRVGFGKNAALLIVAHLNGEIILLQQRLFGVTFPF